MKVLVIGSGGRESALVRKIAESDLVDRIFCAPGNAGTGQIARNVDIKADDIDVLLAFAKVQAIDLTIVGPEKPLADGIVDKFTDAGLKIFGPSKAAAQLEASKIFTKKLLKENNIPTAEFKIFTAIAQSRIDTCLQRFGLPIVIKVDGLAAGKGAIVCWNEDEVAEALRRIKAKEFGAAGDKFIIEKFLPGQEASYIVLVDKSGHILSLATSQDHKPRYEHDSGISPNPNTGGMGAYSPAPVVTDEVEERILERIVKPTIQAMADRGTPSTGVLYAGLMIDNDGNPFVVEFNVRFGDPEIQPILARMKSDIVPIILAALEGKLDTIQIEWDPRPAVSVVKVSGPYPGSYETGFVISGIKEAEATGAIVDHAGTALDSEGNTITAGGRVVDITALGENFVEATANAYEAANKISWKGCDCRNDIAWRVAIE